MSEPRRKEKRATVLIDRELQLSFIGRLGGALLFYLLLFLVVSVVAPVAFTFLGDPPEWALMETAFRVEVLLRLILAPMLCTFFCLFVHGVRETFRIAGPNHRFKAVMRDLQRLRVPRGVQVRKNDLLQDTATEMHHGLVALHDHIALLKTNTRGAIDQVRVALRATGGGAAEAALVALAKVERSVGAFELVGCAPECSPERGTAGDTVAVVEPIAGDVPANSVR